MLCHPYNQTNEFSLYCLESVLSKQLRTIALFGFHESSNTKCLGNVNKGCYITLRELMSNHSKLELEVSDNSSFVCRQVLHIAWVCMTL